MSHPTQPPPIPVTYNGTTYNVQPILALIDEDTPARLAAECGELALRLPYSLDPECDSGLKLDTLIETTWLLQRLHDACRLME